MFVTSLHWQLGLKADMSAKVRKEIIKLTIKLNCVCVALCLNFPLIAAKGSN